MLSVKTFPTIGSGTVLKAILKCYTKDQRKNEKTNYRAGLHQGQPARKPGGGDPHPRQTARLRPGAQVQKDIRPQKVEGRPQKPAFLFPSRDIL